MLLKRFYLLLLAFVSVYLVLVEAAAISNESISNSDQKLEMIEESRESKEQPNEELHFLENVSGDSHETVDGPIEASIISKECPNVFPILKNGFEMPDEMTFDRLDSFIQNKRILYDISYPFYFFKHAIIPIFIILMLRVSNLWLYLCHFFIRSIHPYKRRESIYLNNYLDRNLINLIAKIISKTKFLSGKDFQLISFIIDCIPYWNLTCSINSGDKCIVSILSLLTSSNSCQSHFRGTLNRSDYMTIFHPYFDCNRYGKDSIVIFRALALFTPEIQLDVVTKYIEANPSLKQLMLTVSFNYRLSEEVIEFLLNSLTEVRLIFPEYNSEKSNCFVFKRTYEDEIQHTVNCEFFKKQVEYLHLYHPILRYSFSDNNCSWDWDTKENFLLGFPSFSVGRSFLTAFKHYNAKIVKRLIELSAVKNVPNYCLAFFLAFNPQKQSEFDSIESLVPYFPENKFENLKNGRLDVVEIAILSQKDDQEIIQVLSYFLRKSSLKRNPKSMFLDGRHAEVDTNEIFKRATGIPSLPNDIDILDGFFTACRWKMPIKSLTHLWNGIKEKFEFEYDFMLVELYEVYLWAVEKDAPIKAVLLEHLLQYSKVTKAEDLAQCFSHYQDRKLLLNSPSTSTYYI